MQIHKMRGIYTVIDLYKSVGEETIKNKNSFCINTISDTKHELNYYIHWRAYSLIFDNIFYIVRP